MSTIITTTTDNPPPPPPPPRTVILIGDIHGHHSKLLSLWRNLSLSAPSFSTALVIFLGDYCDRGPSTSHVISTLISLPSLHPHQTHVHLSGNHDLAFSAFIHCLPPPPSNQPFSATWQEFIHSADREGWYSGPGHERMHVQGRRWGGCIKERWNEKKGMLYKGSIYDAAPTFESYGVGHGEEELVRAVPEEHRRFLEGLVWVHEEEEVWIDREEGRVCCRMIAVHAGLEKARGVEEQMRVLREKDTSVPKVADLHGRADVWEMPKELAQTPTIVVSGHHGKLHIDGLRLIIDEGGGMEDLPIAAMILPSMKIVRDTDNITEALD